MPLNELLEHARNDPKRFASKYLPPEAGSVNALIAARERLGAVHSAWAFVDVGDLQSSTDLFSNADHFLVHCYANVELVIPFSFLCKNNGRLVRALSNF